MTPDTWNHEHFVYDEHQDLMIQLDGVPEDTLPLLNGRNRLSSNLVLPPLRDVMVETDKLMYLSFDHPTLPILEDGTDGTTLTLYWIDTGNLPAG